MKNLTNFPTEVISQIVSNAIKGSIYERRVPVEVSKSQRGLDIYIVIFHDGIQCNINSITNQLI